MNHLQVAPPKQRSTLRRRLGRQFYILRRRLLWLWQHGAFAERIAPTLLPHLVFAHQSLLLRPLQNVNMQLQHNKITNLAIALRGINQVVIHPGQTFSFWKLVGKPMRRKGYVDGLLLQNGRIKAGTGGGLCQLGNLLYWMALHTPLTIKERWRHGYDVFPDVNRAIPFGCGATLSYNYIDLQLQNNTTHTFQLQLWLSDTHLHGQILCSTALPHTCEVFETDHRFQQQWWGGYTRHNKIWKRIINLSDNTLKEEFVTENNAIMMYSPLVEG